MYRSSRGAVVKFEVENSNTPSNETTIVSVNAVLNALKTSVSNLHVLTKEIEGSLSDSLQGTETLATNKICDIQKIDFLRQSLKDAQSVLEHVEQRCQWIPGREVFTEDLVRITDMRESLFGETRTDKCSRLDGDIWL